MNITKLLFTFIFCLLVQWTHAQVEQEPTDTSAMELFVPDVTQEQNENFAVEDSLKSFALPEQNELVNIDTFDVLETKISDESSLYLQGQDTIKSSAFFVPVTCMVYGVWVRGTRGLYSSVNMRKDVQHMFPGFQTPVDKYLQYVPALAAYATGFIPGTKPRHAHGRRLWMFVQAQVLTSVAVLAVKHYTHTQRPNGSDYKSFPSGHTTQAFMGAALFDMEYPRQMKGVKIGLYTLASLTGALAMMNDRHWGSDVFFGAGLGMLSVRLLYWSEQKLAKRKRSR